MTEITVVPAPEPPAPLVEAPAAAKPGALSVFLRAAYERVQKPIARARLKSDLSKLVSMAKDHETNGLAAGHKYYYLLYKLACKKAEAYAELRGIDKQQLYARAGIARSSAQAGESRRPTCQNWRSGSRAGRHPDSDRHRPWQRHGVRGISLGAAHLWSALTCSEPCT